MYYTRAFVLLLLVYLALTSNLEIANIVVGALLAGGVLLLIRPPTKGIAPRDIPASIVAFGRYIGHLVVDLILSGVQVARLVIDPALPIKPGIIAIPAQTSTDLGIALSAHAITLTPGELVVETDEAHLMYTHSLDASHAQESIREAQEVRRELLDKIFP